MCVGVRVCMSDEQGHVGARLDTAVRNWVTIVAGLPRPVANGDP